ncbi:hypothetical protein [Streptomyces fuscichromogenes]|uniref:Uncharacterized protein n=1 Tax=Streptomyces fuscichromogenes TaxID=1324013 RepID=A0A917XJY6_9ACTN|nr:hypothetical protein [Streptomyces fuscichromogenes]GGN32330.1 hypothetical protein GCM10011578_070880 [Streptomyces fuscichromogenes]
MPDHENDPDHTDETDPTESVAVGDGRGYGGSKYTADQLSMPPAWAIAPAPPQPPAEPGDPGGEPAPATGDDA